MVPTGDRFVVDERTTVEMATVFRHWLFARHGNLHKLVRVSTETL